MRVLIPGGHLTPALATIDYILSQPHTAVKIFFLGREYSQDTMRQKSHEASEVAARPQVRFIPFVAPRWQIAQPFDYLTIGFRLFLATLRAAFVLRQQRIQVVLSFGGYQAVPVALAARMLGIPIITHEQTRVIGQATNIIARLATTIAVSHQSTLDLLKPELRSKAVVTGNPVRAKLWEKVSPPAWLANEKLPVLFITGGNQGSLAINLMVKQALPQLVSSWQVIHQCGNPTAEHNYQAELEVAQAQLPREFAERYRVQAWFSETELAWIWQHTTVLVGRAGANTVAEAELFRVPAVFIPLPSAINDEQTKNIQELVAKKAAVLLPQAELTVDRLLTEITQVKTNRAQMVSLLDAQAPTHNAAAQLWQLLQTVAT